MVEQAEEAVASDQSSAAVLPDWANIRPLAQFLFNTSPKIWSLSVSFWLLGAVLVAEKVLLFSKNLTGLQFGHVC